MEPVILVMRLFDFFFSGDLTGLSRLKNLKFLDLGSNYLKNSILSRIDGLSSLTTLYLHDNLLNGTIDIKGNLELYSHL